MIPRIRPLSIVQRTVRSIRCYRAMAPSMPSVISEPEMKADLSDFTNLAREMEANLAQGLKSTSHDFRSDTVTVPTMGMLKAMFTQATFTDDIYSRDPSTVRLEETVAKLTGHESAMFVPSGTMGNQLCIRTHLTQPPHSIICDERTHVYTNEAGGLAMFSQAQATTIFPKNGKFITLEEIIPKILEEDVHYAPTRLVSLENTLHGVVLPYSEAKRISEYIRKEFKGQIKLHLDGARLWNGVVAENIPINDYCALFDSVSLCFSKGMSTPVGSVIVGSTQFINKARHFKKAFGGGIRNPGILSTACLISFNEILPKIQETHIVAKRIAERLEKIGYKFTLPVETNMVFLDLQVLGVSDDTFQQYCAREGVQVFNYHRIVVHHQISEEAVEKLITALTKLMEDVKTGQVKHHK